MTLARILIVGLLARVIFAVFLPLGVDESYAIAVAREFSWSFFDHPPLGFWSGVIVPNLTGWEHPFTYRLPFLIYGTLTTYLMFLIGREAHSERVGLWSALLYTLAPFFFLSGSVFVVPDGPLNLAGAFILYHLIRITKQDRAPNAPWLWVGVGLAVAMMSKYQAGLIPIAMVVYALFAARRWFMQPGPYIASAIGLIGLAPVIIWNIQNDWISFAFQSGRGGGGFEPLNFMRMALGQMMYLLPPVFIMAIAGLRRPGLIGTIALAPILMFNVIYMISHNSLPHWTMPGWQFALPLAAIWMVANEKRLRRAKLWVAGFAVPMWALLFAALLHVNTGILTGFNQYPPDWDDTSEIFDYAPLAPALASRNLMPDLIMANDWINAGRLSTALGGIPTKVLSEPHHFQFMSGQTAVGEALLMRLSSLADSGEMSNQLLDAALAIDPGAEILLPVILYRGNAPYIAVSIVKLTVR